MSLPQPVATPSTVSNTTQPLSLGTPTFSVQLAVHSVADLKAPPSFDGLPSDAKWIQDAYVTLAGQDVVPECADDWLATLRDWVDLEREMGFEWVVSTLDDLLFLVVSRSLAENWLYHCQTSSRNCELDPMRTQRHYQDAFEVGLQRALDQMVEPL